MSLRYNYNVDGNGYHQQCTHAWCLFNRSIDRSVSDMDKNFQRAIPTRISIGYTLTFLLLVSTLGTSNQGICIKSYTVIGIVNEVRSCIELNKHH